MARIQEKIIQGRNFLYLPRKSKNRNENGSGLCQGVFDSGLRSPVPKINEGLRDDSEWLAKASNKVALL
jgi:hypothetical protein